MRYAFICMNELMSKQGKCIMHLARTLLESGPEQRLPAMKQIAEEQSVSVGTVQAAMQYLLNEQVVQVESRGRLGSFVQGLDYARLWALSEQRAMTAILPMPYSRQLEGLATGMRDAFDNQRLDLAMRFLRGSEARIERLHARQCDWVITSRYAAETAWAHGFDVEIALSLGMSTYTIDHVLLLNGSQSLEPDMRVGIDTHSADHAFVVRQVCRGIPVNMVEMDYSAGLDQLMTGRIQATMWTLQGLPSLPDYISVQPVTPDQLEHDYLKNLGEAVIITVPGDVAVQHVLRAALNPHQLRITQNAVTLGQRRAAY